MLTRILAVLSLETFSAGILNYTTFLGLTMYMGQETAQAPWTIALAALYKLRNMFLQTTIYPSFLVH